VTRDPSPVPHNSSPNTDDSDISHFGDPQGDPRGFLNSNATRGPKPPDDPLKPVSDSPVRRRISEPVQAAMLIHRVEPLYPHLAIQLRREGRVELHAVISTDGSIQSLQVISGDPLLIQSALAAVRDWRYHPTILNGQPVEVETRITVVYTLTH
jgi:protein TonB